MIRVFIENVLLFLAPTLIYVAYVMIVGPKADGPANNSQARTAEVLTNAPFLWLFAAGAFLVISTLIAFGSYSGGKPGEVYEPPTMKDGHIEPGKKKSP